MARPLTYDVCFGANELVYASYARVSGRWMGALFARVDLGAGVEVASDIGTVVSDDHASSHYVFSARDTKDLRRRVLSTRARACARQCTRPWRAAGAQRSSCHARRGRSAASRAMAAPRGVSSRKHDAAIALSDTFAAS